MCFYGLKDIYHFDVFPLLNATNWSGNNNLVGFAEQHDEAASESGTLVCQDDPY
jgi:hypothetical protein